MQLMRIHWLCALGLVAALAWSDTASAQVFPGAPGLGGAGGGFNPFGAGGNNGYPNLGGAGGFSLPGGGFGGGGFPGVGGGGGFGGGGLPGVGGGGGFGGAGIGGGGRFPGGGGGFAAPPAGAMLQRNMGAMVGMPANFMGGGAMFNNNAAGPRFAGVNYQRQMMAAQAYYAAMAQFNQLNQPGPGAAVDGTGVTALPAGPASFGGFGFAPAPGQGNDVNPFLLPKEDPKNKPGFNVVPFQRR